jgi:hypothetical protein
MKCPKCGFNSFETHDICKKCANDLTSYKDIHGLKAIVLPLETRTAMAEKLKAERVEDPQAAAVVTPVDMFSFDIPEDDPADVKGSVIKDDPFSFGDETASSSLGIDEFSFGTNQVPAQAKAEEDAFADLLESNSLDKGAAPVIPPSPGPISKIESDLSNFSWDDTPDITPDDPIKPAKDDFDSLFGDANGSVKK